MSGQNSNKLEISRQCYGHLNFSDKLKLPGIALIDEPRLMGNIPLGKPEKADSKKTNRRE
jgi:hypothetical protein